MASDERNSLVGSWIQAETTLAPAGEISVHFLTLESQKNQVPLHNQCRESGSACCGSGPQECALPWKG